jgi:hypothetical protein
MKMIDLETKIEKASELPSEIVAVYQSALDLSSYEGRLTWQATTTFIIFAVILIAGALSPGFIGSESKLLLPIIGFAISLIGIFSTISWWSMVSRCRAIHNYWMATAKELEGHFSPFLRNLRRGYLLAKGDTLEIGGEKIRFSFISRIKIWENFSLLYGSFLFGFTVLALTHLVNIVISVIQSFGI